MLQMIGIIIFLVGVAGVLFDWVLMQKEKEKQLEVFLTFFRKSLAVMQNEKIRVVDYFIKYRENYLYSEKESVLSEALEEISKRLITNTYPNGQMVWEEVFKEIQNWKLDKEMIPIIVQAGNGFFGRSRTENTSFLEKCIRDFEIQQKKIEEENVKRRKVWIPVGMLGSIMLVIIFL